MIVDITNEVFTNIKQAIPSATVLTSYPSTVPTFPMVTFEELSNVSVIGTKDTSGNKYNDLAFEINIFTDGDSKMSDAKSIRNAVDSIMSEKYSMNRDFSGTIPNFLDNNIYRYTLRYGCIVDSNKMIYGR